MSPKKSEEELPNKAYLVIAVGLAAAATLAVFFGLVVDFDGGGGSENRLFSLNEAGISENLDRYSVPSGLRAGFEEAGYTLTENASVAIEEEGERWSIVDENDYLVRRENDGLEVYRAGALDPARVKWRFAMDTAGVSVSYFIRGVPTLVVVDPEGYISYYNP